MLRSYSTVRSYVFRKLFMESVLLKANLVNLSTGQYWLKIDEEKGMSDREGHGHKAVLYKSHFLPLRHSVHQLLERHHCIHRLINHVYNQRTKPFVIPCPTTDTKIRTDLRIKIDMQTHSTTVKITLKNTVKSKMNFKLQTFMI